MQLTLFSVLLIATLTDAYKVLVFSPALGPSHSNFLGKVSDILIDAANDVTMLIPIFMESSRHLVGSKKVKKIIRTEDPRVMKLFKESAMIETLRKKIWTMGSEISTMFSANSRELQQNGCLSNRALVFFQIKLWHGELGKKMLTDLFQQTKLIEQLREEKFDLAISESLFVGAFAFFKEVGIQNTIIADSMLYMSGVKEALGEPAAISYYPGVYSPTTDKMNFMERLGNFMGFLIGYWFEHAKHGAEVSALPESFEGPRDWTEYFAGATFNFINSNQFLDYPSPTLPKTEFVGGMQVDTKRNQKSKLTREWDELLSLRSTNVLVSFGSMAYSSEMPEIFKQSLLKVFASMPETTFIWKYEVENTTLADHLENVKLTAWMPQTDLLADNRLTLFITHGGLGSTVELAYLGTPAIVIPLMADQPRNAHMLTRHGGAIQFDKSFLDQPNNIKNAIKTMLNNPKYKENAEKLAKILEEQPYKPKEVVLRHCDFAVKFGPLESLNSEGRNLNTFLYYSFDISSVIIVLIILILLIGGLVSRTVYRWFKKRFFSVNKTKLE